MQGTTTTDERRIGLRLPHDLFDDLERVAADHDRTVSAELRVAIREHVKRAESEGAS